jgi:iron(III) transport system ATP-binding protein
MTVLQNASFPLEVRARLPGKMVRERAMRVLDTVGLGDFAERESTRLSGGQQQRLALARALVMEPDLLLLDEPLSNLDAKLRERMRLELKRIQRELSVTTIYVTHDQAEALALSDEIVVLKDGRVAQIGSPQAIYGRPGSRFVAEFIGSSNFISAVVLGPESRNGFWQVRSELGDLTAVSEGSFPVGARVTISARPENLEVLENAEGAGSNLIRAKIESRMFQGDFIDLQLRAGTLVLSARAHPTLPATVGDFVSIRIAAIDCVILPDGTA